MIFQGGIQLEIEGRDVQVNFDFDTGFIGFTELIDGELNEYYYSDSPKEFKVAFIEQLKNLFVEKHHINFKICRKNPELMKLTQFMSKLI